MKTPFTYALIGALAVSAVSCTTSYDHYGQPRQSVDPAAATAGIAAAGLIGYALGNNRNRNRNRYYDNHHNQDYHYAPRRNYYRHY